MSFISIEYIILFCVVVSVHFALPQKRRWILLLIASYVFYSFSEVSYVLLIAFSTLVDFLVSQRLSNVPVEKLRLRRLLLAISIVVNLGVLFVFKYFNFFSQSTAAFLASIGADFTPLNHNLILPVGISFYTFQSMAYTIDVYRNKLPAEKNPGIFATYVAFFPQLVAGPIERAPNLLPQFYKHFVFDYDRVVSGLRLILWGAFKKIVIADRLAVYVNAVYNDVDSYYGITLVAATIFFAYQIYCDFSGYSDIAIGSARVLGFDLMTNFRRPYLSRSIREFWGRWHISLSTWFRDYLYIPLGGNRKGFTRTLINLMIVFLVSGLWHGASWTFVIWGGLHGMFIIVETIMQRYGRNVPNRQSWARTAIQQIITFGLVCAAWVFFRANSLEDVQTVFRNMMDFSRGASGLYAPFASMSFNPGQNYILSWLLIIGLQLSEWRRENRTEGASRGIFQYALIRWSLYYAAVGLIILTLVDITVEQQFIYFQF